ncbi:MAG: glycosyltransferase family 2 protein [Clostridia bacterium]|nr:glycosyltransferase family 2 protein [Clostridia bacterium]
MLLSVIIPVYNCEKYIRQCVYSILSQPCAEQIEIIIVDDGSPDKSGDICDEIADSHSNVTVIHKENGGVSSARNAGIEKATGEFIAFVDGDDWWEKDFFDKNILEELSKGYDLYGFSYNYVVNDKYYQTFRVESELKCFDKNCKGKCDYAAHFSYIYSRELIKKCGLEYPIGISIGEDMVFLEKYFYFIRSYKKINKVMYNYRKNTMSVTHSIKMEKSLTAGYNASYNLYEWYNSIGEEFNFHSVCGMVFSGRLDDLCGENTYKYCKNYIYTDARFNCIENYKNIAIPPYYYPKVKHFMEHTFLFWLCKKVKYKISKMLLFLAEKFKFLHTLYDYIIYRVIRRYKKIEN